MAWLTDAGDGWHSPGALESGATRPRETVRGAASFHRPTNCSKSGGESGILSGPFVQTLCIQRNAANRSPYRHLGSITSGTVVTEKTLINPDRPDCSMDGMDSISSSRHKPPPRINTPAPGFRNAARRVVGFMMTAPPAEICRKSRHDLVGSKP